MPKQPKALTIFFLTEMWEQYGFYTLQPLLVFLLIKRFAFSDVNAYLFSAQFAALVYLTPVIGGWVADNCLGKRFAVLLGGSLLCVGYALLALQQSTLSIGLSFIIIGHGLFKPNIVGMLGEFYGQHDSHREAGFTLFYVGINIGALIAMFFAGYIQKWFGWTACFVTASFMLLLAVSFFRAGFRYFADKGLAPHFQSSSSTLFIYKNPMLLIGLCLSIILAYYSLTLIHIGNAVLIFFGILFCCYIAKLLTKLDSNSRKRLLGLLLLFVIAIFYKAMFFETYLVVNVFTDRIVNRTLFDHIIPATVFLGLGGFFSILLGPLWAKLWQSVKINFPIPLKFALGILLIGICMQILAYLTVGSSTFLPAIWIVFFRFLFAISELFIFPVAFAAISEYSPQHCTGTLMGSWFMSAAFGGKLAGLLAVNADVPKAMNNLYQMNAIYHHAFQHYALLNFAAFFVCLLLTPLIHKLLQARNKK